MILDQLWLLQQQQQRPRLGVYAMALFVLGFGDFLGSLIDVSGDDTGLLLDRERLPKRVRMKKARS